MKNKTLWKTFKIKIPKELYEHVTAKVLQDSLNIRWGGFAQKFKIREEKQEVV